MHALECEGALAHRKQPELEAVAEIGRGLARLESGRLALLKSLLTIRTSGPLLRKIICGCFSNEFFGAVYTHGGLLLKLALLFAS